MLATAPPRRTLVKRPGVVTEGSKAVTAKDVVGSTVHGREETDSGPNSTNEVGHAAKPKAYPDWRPRATAAAPQGGPVR